MLDKTENQALCDAVNDCYRMIANLESNFKTEFKYRGQMYAGNITDVLLNISKQLKGLTKAVKSLNKKRS